MLCQRGVRCLATGAPARRARLPSMRASDKDIEPLLPMPMLGGLACGVPAATWVANTGAEFLCSTFGASAAMLGAPAIVTLFTAVGAATGVSFEQRIAALPAEARFANSEDARFKLVALLVLGTLCAGNRVGEQIGSRPVDDAPPS